MSERIIVLGPTYVDHTIRLKDSIYLDGSARIDKEEIFPGGTGLCYAVALSRLENSVVFHSVVGTDERAEEIIKTMASEPNLQAEWQKIEGKTDYAYILIDRGNHKTAASMRILTDKYDPDAIPSSLLQDTRALVLTSFKNDILARVLERVRSGNVSQSYIMWAPHLQNCENASTLYSYLSLVDHITLSKDEYRALYEQIGNPIDQGVKSVTITNGKNGCDLLTSEGFRHYNALRVIENPFDTNGAGEAFGSGFLTAIIETGDYETAVRAGSYLGFLHVHRAGSDFPTVSKKELLHIAELTKSDSKLPMEVLIPQSQTL